MWRNVKEAVFQFSIWWVLWHFLDAVWERITK